MKGQLSRARLRRYITSASIGGSIGVIGACIFYGGSISAVVPTLSLILSIAITLVGLTLTGETSEYVSIHEVQEIHHFPNAVPEGIELPQRDGYYLMHPEEGTFIIADDVPSASYDSYQCHWEKINN